MGRRDGLADLIAVHHGGEAARETIERLSRAGIDGGAIVLLRGAEVVTPGRYGDRQTDRGSAIALGVRLLRGALLGTVPGGVFGAVVLALASDPTPVVVLSGAGGGALFGASVGALTGLLSLPTMTSSWERTFSPLVPGGVAVGVRIGSARDDRRVRRVLRVAPAITVHEVDDLDDAGGWWAPLDGSEA